jgi:adenylosuccinate lyase
MRANLGATGGLVLSEQVMMALAARTGRQRAHELVKEVAGRVARSGRSFREELLAEPEVAERLGAEGVDAALDPARYLGSTQAFVDRALASHRERTRSGSR